MPLQKLRALGLAGLAAVVVACGAVAMADRSAGAAVTPGVKPDIVLSHESPVFRAEYSSLLLNDLSPQADPTLAPTPDQCRDLPPLDVVCDVYRFKIQRTTAKGAQNFVQVIVDWPSQVATPALALAVAGLSDSDVPDIDLFLYENPDVYVEYELVGGRGAVVPERIVWEATQDEYDLVIRAGAGVATEYSIRASLSDERFSTPFEALDPTLSPEGPARQPETPDNDIALPSTPPAPPALDFAPVADDQQIAGIGLGTAEQFDAQALTLPPTTRTVAASAKAPSTIALIAAMLAFPTAAAVGAVLLLRRRRSAFLG